MTTKQVLHKQLTDNGMFDSQADKVLEIAIPEIEKLVPNYRITWDRPASEYPEQIFYIWWWWWWCLKPIALKWIEENAPQACFKPCFE